MLFQFFFHHPVIPVQLMGLADMGPGGCAHLAAQRRVGQQPLNGPGKRAPVAHRHQQTGPAVLNRLRHPGVVKGHHRQPAGLGLQVHHAQGFLDAGEHEQVGRAVIAVKLLPRNLAGKNAPVADLVPGQPLEMGALFSVPDDDQCEFQTAPPQLAAGADHPGEPFGLDPRPEHRHRQHHGVLAGTPLPAQFGASARVGGEVPGMKTRRHVGQPLLRQKAPEIDPVHAFVGEDVARRQQHLPVQMKAGPRFRIAAAPGGVDALKEHIRDPDPPGDGRAQHIRGLVIRMVAEPQVAARRAETPRHPLPFP